jgi:hypothetical protein
VPRKRRGQPRVPRRVPRGRTLAQQQRKAFTAERDYYRHDTLPDDGARWGILDDIARRDLRDLYGMRIKADYQDDPVEFEEAERMAALAAKLVKGLLG